MATQTETRVDFDWEPAATRTRSWPLDRDVTVAIGGATLTAVLGFLFMWWAYGSPQPAVFSTPDEAVNRLAAQLVTERGVPAYEPPIEDPENLIHMRFWFSNGEDARPAYPPFVYYAYGLAARVGPIGEWLPLIVASVGLGALAAAGALAAQRRPLLGVFLPFIAFPVGVWISRPWMNFSPFYSLVALTALCVVLWGRTSQFRYLATAAALTGVAGATRPDQLLFVFGGLYLLALAMQPGSWRSITVSLFVSGTGAVLVIALLNWAVVGDPLQSGYEELATETGATEARDRAPGRLTTLAYAIAPFGVSLGAEAWHMLAKYWLLMGTVSLLTALGLAGYAQALRRNERTLLLVALGGLVLLFVLTRLCAGCFGADASFGTDAPFGTVRHSVPRYLGMAYLLFGFATLRLVSGSPRRVATGALVTLALTGMLLFAGNLLAEHFLAAAHSERAARTNRYLPEGTVLYTWVDDKIMWAEDSLTVATVPPDFKLVLPMNLDEAAPSVPPASYDQLIRSIQHSRRQGRPVAVSRLHPAHVEELVSRLRAVDLRVVPVRQLELTWLVWEIERQGSLVE